MNGSALSSTFLADRESGNCNLHCYLQPMFGSLKIV